MATSYRKLPSFDPKDLIVLPKTLGAPKLQRPLADKLQKLDVPTPLYDVTTILDAVRKLGRIESKNLQPGQSFTLSARQAWIEGRGWIEAFNVVCVAPTHPTIQFIQNVGSSDEGRHVDIWLSNLVPGRSYIAQVRVQAGQGGTFHIGTGEGDHLTAPGGDRTIPVLLFTVERDLSLISIKNLGASYWAFADVTITAIET